MLCYTINYDEDKTGWFNSIILSSNFINLNTDMLWMPVLKALYIETYKMYY